MKRLVIIGFLWVPMSLVAQIRFNAEYSETPLTQVIQDIEGASEFRFYYHLPWLDTISVTGSFEADIRQVIRDIMLDVGLEYVQIDQQVIVTGQTRIITDLGIGQRADSVDNIIPVEKGLIFRREYQDELDDSPESQVYEIGQVRQMIKGANITLAGYVRERESGKPVDGALVYLESPFIGTTADDEGFYTLTIPNGKHKIHFQSLNMKNTYRNIVAFSSGRLDVEMEIDVIALKSVTVSADRDVNVTSAKMGVTRIDVAESKTVPVLLGEQDLIKVATTTSGVQTAGEAASGLNIRGGKADQNLFLLDGAPVYNTAHFFGFFSVFNAESIESMDLYKSAIPGQFGGRLSSVFDFETKTPDKEKFTAYGGIGPVTSRLMVETPIIKDKTSLMVGGRATYSDYVLKQIENSPLGNNQASFFDVIGRLHHKISDSDEVSVTAYHSFDQFQLAADSLLSYTNFSYSNTNVSVRWDHTFKDNLRGSLLGTYSNYDYDIGYEELASQAFNIDFGVRDYGLKTQVDYFYDEKLAFNAGWESRYFQVSPGFRVPVGGESLVLEDKVDDEYGWENGIFIEGQYDPNESLSLSAGLRYSFFSALGPATVFGYDQGGPRAADNRIDTTRYSRNETIAFYHGPEWRISGRYSLSESLSLKMSINRMRQNIHLLINAASVAPTDIWRLSSKHIRPQIADQFSVGLYKNFERKHVIETSVELYYKRIQNLLDFKVGADLQFNKAIETDVLQGPGRAYGMEFSIKKSSGWFTGWINYTLSRSLIQLDGNDPSERINQGQFFSTNYDIPHYINSVTNYKFTRRFSLSVNMVYSTGRPITYPVGKWVYRDVENIHYSDRNEFRLPDYFRVDVGLNIEGSHKIKKLAHSFWTFSVYNLLGRDNIYSIFFNVEDGQLKGYQMSVFPDPIPTITYNFKF